jgi:hypothetical protein
MMKLKRDLIFIFFILAGAIVGALIAGFANQISAISWLAFGKTVGLWADSPMVLDLLIFRLTFGFEMQVNVAQILCILIAMLAYKGVGKKI